MAAHLEHQALGIHRSRSMGGGLHCIEENEAGGDQKSNEEKGGGEGGKNRGGGAGLKDKGGEEKGKGNIPGRYSHTVNTH